MKPLLIALCSFSLLAACAIDTRYAPMTVLGGVQATRITNDTYQIEAKGNIHTSPAKIQQFVLLKAAETALENGYEGFDIISAQDASQSSASVHNGVSQTYSDGAGGYYSFGSPSYVSNNTKPRMIAAVRMIQQAKDASFNAKEIANNLGPVLKANSATSTQGH